MSDLPTADQVRALPAQADREVTSDVIDENGHMNIAHYFHPAAYAVWETMQQAGVDADYIAHRGLSFFTVEHHLRYLAEMRLGDRFTVRPQLLERSDKVLHALSYVLDETHDRLACVLEVSYVHVSMEDRRAVPVPDDVAAALDRGIAAGRLGWDPPVTGTMGVRRR